MRTTMLACLGCAGISWEQHRRENQVHHIGDSIDRFQANEGQGEDGVAERKKKLTRL
jgi:hypothetical protein